MPLNEDKVDSNVSPVTGDTMKSIIDHTGADTDSSAFAIHHTLGHKPTQASPGSHRHDGKDSYKIDYTNIVNIPTIGVPASYTGTVKHLVRNSTGSTLHKGQVVYVTGANGTHILVGLSDADTEATSSKTVGFLDQDLVNNADGYVITDGLIDNVDTSAAPAAGAAVWLSSTAGGYVFTSPPAKPAHSVYLGVVVRKNVSNGQIFVKVQNGFELTELHNVFTDNGFVADNEVLAYNSGTNLWINQTAAEAGLATTAQISFAYTQGALASTWAIAHNLGYKPNVVIQNSGGATIEGELLYTDNNNLTVSFSQALTGVAYLS